MPKLAIGPALVDHEYAITKRSDTYKNSQAVKIVWLYNARVKKDVKSKVAAKKWF